MAKLIWHKRAEQELFRYLVKGEQEFGSKTANDFAKRIEYINSKLTKFPEIGYPEPLLKDRNKIYRAYLINHRFKLIYYYSTDTNTVHVADIWDTRREPTKLRKRV